MIPSIKAPPGTPRFQWSGHAVAEDWPYAKVKFTTGHTRTRRRYTVAERRVEVAWFLEADQLAAIDDWYQNALQVGTREFAAEVKTLGDGVEWWTARWIQYECDMRPRRRGRITGTIFLTGEPSDTGPSGSELSMRVRAPLTDIRAELQIFHGLAMSVSASLISINEGEGPSEDAFLREDSGFILREDDDFILRE